MVKSFFRIFLIGAILAVPHTILLWPILFGGRVFADGDAVLQMYPAATALKEALITGLSFAWNPHILTGFPMAASFVGGFFSPLYQLLFHTFDSFDTYHVLTLLNFTLTAWLTYACCKLLKLSTASSLFAGLVFPLSTAYWLFGSNLTVTSGFPLIPGLLVSALLIQRRHSIVSKIIISIASGAVLGLLLLQSHPQWPIMAMLMAGAFAVFIDVQRRLLLKKSLLSTQTISPPSSPTLIGDPEIKNKQKQTVIAKESRSGSGRLWRSRSGAINEIASRNARNDKFFLFSFLDSRLRGKDEKNHLSFVIWNFFKTLTTSLRITYWLLFTFITGLLLSLPQLLASTRVGDYSARGAGIALSKATSGSLLPADFLSFILPNLNLPFVMQKPYLLYGGAVPLLLFVISLIFFFNEIKERHRDRSGNERGDLRYVLPLKIRGTRGVMNEGNHNSPLPGRLPDARSENPSLILREGENAKNRFTEPRNASNYYPFFLSIFIISILISIKYSPLFWLIHQLPILNAFREPSRFMYLGLFAFTVIATYGLNWLTNAVNTPVTDKLKTVSKWLTRASLALAFLALIATGVVSLWGDQILNFITSYFDTRIYSTTTGLPLEHYHNVIRQLFDQVIDGITFFNLQTAIGIVSLFVGSLLVHWDISRRSFNNNIILDSIQDPEIKNKQKKDSFGFLFSFLDSCFRRNDGRKVLFSSGVILLALINLVGVKIGTLHTVPRSLIETPPASASVLSSSSEPFRVFSFLPGASIYQELDSRYGYDPEANIEATKEMLLPNLNILSHVDSLDYYDDLMDRRNARLLSYLGSNRGTFGESLAEMDVPFEEKKTLFLERLQLLSMANVKYITSLYPLDHPRLKLISKLQVTSYKLQVFVYENLDVLPRYYLTNDVEVTPIRSEEESWGNLLKHKITENTEITKILIESDLLFSLSPERSVAKSKDFPNESRGVPRTPVASQPLRQAQGISAVYPTLQSNTHYTFTIETNSDQWFIFSQNNLPGWTVTIDGTPTQSYRANFLFQAIRVPAGKHVVEWEYVLF